MAHIYFLKLPTALTIHSLKLQPKMLLKIAELIAMHIQDNFVKKYVVFSTN